MRRLASALVAVVLLVAGATPATAQIYVWQSDVTAPVFGSPTFTGQSFGPPSSVCTAPMYSATGATTTGYHISVTPALVLCVNGVAVGTVSSAGRLDMLGEIRSGTNLYVPAGGLIGDLSNGSQTRPNDGQVNFANNAATAGIGMDFTTDSQVDLKTRAQTAFATARAAKLTVVTANAGTWERGEISELLTLSTSGSTTDTTANLLPANSIIEAVVARVTTTITTATDWKLGDATIVGRFSAANATMTAGTTQVGLVHVDLTTTSGPRQTSAAKLRVTTTGTPGAGAIRITVFFRTFVPPTS